MIIDIFFFSTLSILSLLCLAGLGALLSGYKNNFLLNIFSGYLVVSLLVTFFHFFFEVNFFILFFIFFTGIFFHIKNYDYSFKEIGKKYYCFILVFLILIPIFISQKYHEDFGYYHLPYAVNLISEKIIFGLGNLNDGFVHNSIWLNIFSLFYFQDDYSFMTLPTFLLYITFIIYSIDQIINQKRYNNSNYFLIICIFYFILKFTRISEFGNDIPALIYSILGVYFFLKYEEEENSKKKSFLFFTHVSFVAFAILIKFSIIPIITLTFFVFFRDFRILHKEIFRYNYLIIYLLIISFFFQQLIYTGCFIFPSNITCLDVSWFNSEFLNLRNKLELVNKSYSTAREFFTSDEYLKNFNWLPYWIKRNYLEIAEHFFTMLFPVIVFLFLLKKNFAKNHKKNVLKISIIFLIIGFYFWFSFSPVYRFGILYFLFFIFIITSKIYMQKIFSQKIFITLLILCLTFNFSKNLKRISEKNIITFGIDGVKNEYIEFNDNVVNEKVSVFRPNIEANNLAGNGWQGRLCWDIPFICSYNKIKVNLVNNYIIINSLK
ncbi:LIC_10190 family membrane protein [Candidatus Pelagibacter sp. HIMB1321]|uniref:LIC_10190 family membrane protein n=1 Tax=Candidatus Pelagibacter sp. HIMB1321 TaxID=1388755 RepID=UPI000A07F516|nr:hypothetical protein [Candidatus Pelagibacter sp. HIMB1321]SMF79381.1 hypothetical protein SAMN02744631_1029 [Candidatus Pelagibacter sp. HIMB1321]